MKNKKLVVSLKKKITLDQFCSLKIQRSLSEKERAKTVSDKKSGRRVKPETSVGKIIVFQPFGNCSGIIFLFMALSSFHSNTCSILGSMFSSLIIVVVVVM